MDKVVKFKSRKTASPIELTPKELARSVLLLDIESAMRIASLVYQDLEAVEMLNAVYLDALRRGVGYTRVNPDVLRRCSGYLHLVKDDEYDRKIKQMYTALYGFEFQ